MPQDPHRNAFGALVVDPEKLPRAEKWDCLRRVAGALLAGRTREEQWLGRVLQERLHEGGDLEQMLGLRPSKGSTRTPERAAREESTRRLLLQLSTIVGGDAQASQILRGVRPVPRRAAAVVSELQTLGAPTSRSALTRARSASRDS